MHYISLSEHHYIEKELFRSNYKVNIHALEYKPLYEYLLFLVLFPQNEEKVWIQIDTCKENQISISDLLTSFSVLNRNQEFNPQRGCNIVGVGFGAKLAMVWDAYTPILEHKVLLLAPYRRSNCLEVCILPDGRHSCSSPCGRPGSTS